MKTFTRLSRILSPLLVVVLFLSDVEIGNAQRLSKSDKAKANTFCYNYLGHKYQFLKNENDRNMVNIVSDSIYSLFKLQRTYFNLMDYRMASQQTYISVYDVKKLDHRLQCEMYHSDTFLYSIELVRNDTSFRIVSFNNDPNIVQYFTFYTHQIDSLNRIQQIKKDVELSTKSFIDGLNDLYLKGEPSLLKKYTTPTNYSVLLLRNEKDSLRGFNRKKPYVIREMDDTQILNDSVATCHISTNSGNSTMDLRKIANRWVVIGENGHQSDSTDVQEAYDQLVEHQAFQNINQDLDTFNKIATHFFKHGDVEAFSRQTSDQVAGLLDLLRYQVGIDKCPRVKIYGFWLSTYGDNVVFNDDYTEVVFEHKEVEITLQKKDIWRVVGMDADKAEHSTHFVHQHFRKYVNALHLSVLSNMDDEMYVDAVMEVGEVDTSIIGQLSHYRLAPQPSVGYDSLFALIHQLTRPFAKEHNQTEKVYVEFVIELDGSISHVKVVSTSNPSFNQSAITVLKQLPSWVPGKIYSGVVRSTYLLPITF